MSLNAKFSKTENKKQALAKIWWVWKDTNRSYAMYSLPENDEKGLETAVESLVESFINYKYLNNIKDELIYIFDNQTKQLLRKYKSGRRVYE